MNMRVAYVLKSFPRLSETFILNEMLALRARGVDVRVFAFERSAESVRHPAAAEWMPSVTWLDTTPGPEFEALGDVPERHRAAAVAGLRLGGALRSWGAQHVHAHFAGPAATAAAFAAATSGLAFTFTAHAKDIFVAKVDWTWLRTLARQAHAVVTVSEYNRRFLEPRLPAAHVTLVYNGVDLDAFRPRARSTTGAGPVVGVGRFVRKKGFHVLVEALAHLRAHGHAPRVVLAGEGRERAALEARVRELGLQRQVRFAGALTQPEVRSLLRRASAVALPCVVDGDGNQDALPTVLLEAAACGVPAVSTRVAGVPEIVAHGRTGWVVRPDDARAVARALGRLLESPERAARMGAAARRRAERMFDQKEAVGALARLFRAAARTRDEEDVHAYRAAVS